LVPELVEGEKKGTPFSAALFASRRGGGERSLRLIPFGKLRDQKKILVICLYRGSSMNALRQAQGAKKDIGDLPLKSSLNTLRLRSATGK